MRAVVAGGTGFIGAGVAAAFVRNGYEVRSLSRRAPVEPAEGIEYAVCDLERDDPLAALHGANVAVFAATTTTPASAASDVVGDLSSNVVAAVRFANAAAQARPRAVVLVSSGGTVYGLPRHSPVDESHPTDPISAYGVARLAVEKYFALAAFEAAVPTVILRVGNAYGEGQLPGRGQGAPAAFLAGYLRGDGVEIWGDGSVVRDYVHVEDVGRACVLAAERAQQVVDAENKVVINVGGGRGVSLLELLALCSAVTGRTVPVAFARARPLDVPAIVLDSRRAAELLGWSPAVELRDGLRRQADWLAAQGFVG